MVLALIWVSCCVSCGESDGEAWNRARASSEAEMLRAFLDDFPESDHAEAAGLMLDSMLRERSVRPGLEMVCVITGTDSLQAIQVIDSAVAGVLGEDRSHTSWTTEVHPPNAKVRLFSAKGSKFGNIPEKLSRVFAELAKQPTPALSSSGPWHRCHDSLELSEVLVLRTPDLKSPNLFDVLGNTTLLESEKVIGLEPRSERPVARLAVEFDPHRLVALGLAAPEVADRILKAEAVDPKTLAGLVLATSNGQTVLLRDVARVMLEASEITRVAWWGEERVQSLGVYRRTPADPATRAKFRKRIAAAIGVSEEDITSVAVTNHTSLEFQLPAGVPEARFNEVLKQIRRVANQADRSLVEGAQQEGVVRVIAGADPRGLVGRVTSMLPSIAATAVRLRRPEPGRVLWLEAKGASPEVLLQARQLLIECLRDLDGVLALRGAGPSSTDEVQTRINTERARGVGLDVESILRTIQLRLNGLQSPSGDVVIRFSRDWSDRSTLAGLPLLTSGGSTIPLSSVVDFEQSRVQGLASRDGQLMARVEVILPASDSLKSSLQAIRNAVSALSLPEGAKIVEQPSFK